MEINLAILADILMIIWLLTLGAVLECGRRMADENVMAGAVGVATLSVMIYSIIKYLS